VEFVLVILVCLAAVGLAFWLEGQVERVDAKSRSRELHPAGSRCPDCQRAIEDWDSHRKLFHQSRVAAPEDVW
jgi:Zn ribbon nucleic-acid-binding protein